LLLLPDEAEPFLSGMAKILDKFYKEKTRYLLFFTEKGAFMLSNMTSIFVHNREQQRVTESK
jgi:hypothetical protein